MNNLKSEYDRLVSEKEKIIEQIDALKDTDIVKKYLELCSKSYELENRQKALYKQMKREQYSSCNHIWINTLHNYDKWEGRSHDYHGCIKCGLDQRVFHLRQLYSDLDLFTLEQRVMYDFMKECLYYSGIDTKILCDLDLAKAVYSKIKEVHPNIDDETALKYFVVALNDIRKIEVSDERKVNRAKRLSLSPKFDRWTGWDVYC